MWTTVSLALISPFITLLLAIWGFRRVSNADKLRAFFDMQDRYLDEKVRNGRSILHRTLNGRSADEVLVLNPEEQQIIGYSLAVMNSLAIACEGNFIPRIMVVESMGRSYATTMQAAKPFIDHYERVRGYRPYRYAEKLGQYMDQRLGPVDRAPADLD